MAQAGYTPISLYYSTTASAVPVAGNLASGELAINITDGKLYYKNNSGVVTLLAGATAGPAGGSNTQVQFNSSGVLAGSANLTFNGTTLTANTIGAFTLSGTIAGGGNQINNVIIGTTTPLAGAFTTLSATKGSAGLVAFFLSGNSAQSPYISFGRAAEDVRIQIAAATNDLFTGTAAGDYATNSNGSIWFGTGGNPITKISSTGLAVTGNSLTLTGTGSTALITSTSSTTTGAYAGYKGSGDPTIQIGQFSASNAGTTFGLSNANLSFIYTTTYASTPASALLIGTAGATPLVFATSGTEAARFTTNQNFLIGTTTESAKLTVSGNIYANNFGSGATAFSLQDTASAVNQFIDINLATGGGAYNSLRIGFGGSNIISWGSALSSYTNNLSFNSPAGSVVFNSNGIYAGSFDTSQRFLINTPSAVYTNSKIQATASSGPTIGIQQTTATEYVGGFWNSAASPGKLIQFFIGAAGSPIGDITGTTNTLNINGPTTGSGIQLDNAGGVAVRGSDNVDFTWLKLKSGISAGNVKTISWEDTGGTVLAKDSITFSSGIITRNFGSFYNSGATTNNILSLNSLGGTLQNYSGHALTPVLYLNNGYGATGDTTACIRMNLNGGAGGGYLWGYDGDTEWTHNMEYIASTGNVARANTASQISQTGGVILFYTNTGTTAGSTFTPSERGRFPATGGFQSVTTISVGNAAPSSSGAGITFPATVNLSSNANTLDDYEEGTFDCYLNFGSTTGSGTGITYNNNSGTYVKIGKVVTLRVGFYLSNKGSSTGTAFLTNLPFRIESLSYCDATGVAGYGSMSLPALSYGVIFVGANNAFYCTIGTNGSTTNTSLTDTSFANNSYMFATFVYTTLE
jgi:hypothetical protein